MHSILSRAFLVEITFITSRRLLTAQLQQVVKTNTRTKEKKNNIKVKVIVYQIIKNKQAATLYYGISLLKRMMLYQELLDMCVIVIEICEKTSLKNTKRGPVIAHSILPLCT